MVAWASTALGRRNSKVPWGCRFSMSRRDPGEQISPVSGGRIWSFSRSTKRKWTLEEGEHPKKNGGVLGAQHFKSSQMRTLHISKLCMKNTSLSRRNLFFWTCLAILVLCEVLCSEFQKLSWAISPPAQRTCKLYALAESWLSICVLPSLLCYVLVTHSGFAVSWTRQNDASR